MSSRIYSQVRLNNRNNRQVFTNPLYYLYPSFRLANREFYSVEFVVSDLNERNAKKKLLEWFVEWAKFNGYQIQVIDEYNEYMNPNEILAENNFDVYYDNIYFATYMPVEYAIGSDYYRKPERYPIMPEFRAATVDQKRDAFDLFPSYQEMFDNLHPVVQGRINRRDYQQRNMQR